MKYSVLLWGALVFSAVAFAQTAPANVPADSSVAVAAPDSAVVNNVASTDSVAPAVADSTAPVDSTAAKVASDSAASEIPETVAAVEIVPANTVAVPVDSAESTPVAANIYGATDTPAENDSSVAAQRGWTHLVGVGATVPVSQYKVEGKKIDVVDVGAALSYTGVSSFGLALKFSVLAGSALTDNIKFAGYNDDWQVGDFSNVEFGFGFSPINGNVTLALMAVAGFETVSFVTDEREFKHADLGKVDRIFEEDFSALTLGGDLYFRVGLSKHVGIFASVGGRWVAYGVAQSKVKYTQDDYARIEMYERDVKGVYSVVPALGVAWKF